MYYLETRYYDPHLGRFLNPDSLDYLGDGEDLKNYNLFAYCGNNPVMYSDPTGHSISAIIIGAAIGAAIGFAATVYADYKDDGKIFNGSVSVRSYVNNTIVDGVVGGFIGWFATSTFTFNIPKLGFATTNIGTTQLVAAGSITVSVSGVEILAGLGVIGLGILCFGKPNSGRIRFSDGTGIDPTTGKEFIDSEEARNFYNKITDPIEKNKWKKWLKGKGWRKSHLKWSTNICEEHIYEN